MKKMVLIAPQRSVIALHNHASSSVPSMADIKSARKYKYGLIICHNGRIFKYTVSPEFNSRVSDDCDFLFANLEKYLYDASGKDMTILINEKLYMLKKKGIDFEVLK